MTAFFVGLDIAIALFKRHRWLLVGLPLAIGLGIQTFRLNSTRADLLEKQAIISNMELASKQARAEQIALNLRNHEILEKVSENARIAHAENRAAVANAVADYAASHSLRKACGGIASQADPAAMPNHPSAPDSPDGNEVVAVPRSDFEALSKDALRGSEARAFLIDLANEGLAVIKPVPAPSQP